MRLRWLSPAALALASLSAGSLALGAQEKTVWRIGTFDHTGAEFGGRAGNQPVVVDADAADAPRRWPASQAGSLNASAGPESHTRTVRFALGEAPRGAFALDFAVLAGDRGRRGWNSISTGWRARPISIGG